MVKKTYKILRRVFFYALFTLIILVSAGLLSVWLYGEEIKGHIIRNFNESINTPINVASIDINALTYFPYVTIQLRQVDVIESYAFSEKSLLKVDLVEFKLNPISLLMGDYSVNTVVLSNGNLDMRVNRRFEVNYEITKSQESADPDKATNFDIENVIFNNINFTWEHVARQQYFSISTEKLRAQIEQKDTTLLIGLEGLLAVNHLRFDKSSYLEEKSFETRAELLYYNKSGQVNVADGLLAIEGSDFRVDGYYNPTEQGTVDFTLKGMNTTIQSLVSLLPENIAKRTRDYRSKGDIFFDMRLKGKINATESPGIEAHFGVSNATITYPETGQSIDNTTLTGRYYNSSLTDFKKAELELTNISGILDNRPLKGSFTIRNFDDPTIKVSVQGSFDVKGLLGFFPQEYISSPSGDIDLDVSFTGRINDLNSLTTINRVRSKGEITLANVSFESSQLTKSFQDLQGTLRFNRNSLEMEHLSGHFGKSQFVLNGQISNIFSFLLTDKQPLKLRATLLSDMVDIDELLSARVSESSGDYSLMFSPLLDLEFDCNLKKIHFRRFSGEKLSGVFKIKDQLAMLQQISFEEVGGSIKLEGLVDTKGPVIDVLTRFSTKNIHIDSLFYVFEDFGQDFLVHSYLKGVVTSSVSAELRFTKSLQFIPQSLTADMQLKIEGGGLIGFEPMKALSAYIPDDSLHYLRFSNLENEVHVENQTIYLPKMEVRSNVTSITIGGTYTFDNHINYKVVAPIIHTRRLDRDKVFGAIEEDNSGIPKIHLLLTGTTDDYTVSLDREGMKNQLVTDLKTEVVELKQAFLKKQKDKQKALVLDEEDEFDW